MEWKKKRFPDDVGAVCLSGAAGDRQLSLEEILLDETIIGTHIFIKKAALSSVGGMNHRLEAKREYELLLRIAGNHRILKSCQMPEAKDWVELKIEPEEEIMPGILTDCYVISRYKKELLLMNCFQEAVAGVLETAGAAGKEKEIVSLMEGMLQGSWEYWFIFEGTQPILIYTGDDICYHVLSGFAEYLGKALERQGQAVEFFDSSKRGYQELADYAHRRYKAIIGMQTYMFSVKMISSGFIHDEIYGPKYNFIFDHPIWMNQHLMETPRDLCIMTLDRNYAAFIEKYYGVKARFLPPGGVDDLPVEKAPGQEVRSYDVSFVGSYGFHIKRRMEAVHNLGRKSRFLINRYLLNMRRNTKLTPEKALKQSFDYYGFEITDELFLKVLRDARVAIYCIFHHYRAKVLKALLEGGITVHVFGESWKECPFQENPNLICHPAAEGKECLKVYRSSKVSLNIMAWHKDGFTERIADSMLQKAVVVSDKSVYLEQNFEDGREMVLYDLDKLEELPGMVRGLLECEDRRREIAEAGYEKARKYHTWDCRAKEMLDIIEEDSRKQEIK